MGQSKRGWDRKGRRGARGIGGTEGRRMGQGGIDCGEEGGAGVHKSKTQVFLFGGLNNTVLGKTGS